MTASKSVEEFFKKNGINYKVLEHPRTITAQETAAAQHIPGAGVLKAVIVNTGGKYAMCVLSANHIINFDKLKQLIGSNHIELATEEELKPLFPNVELGAEPPIGTLYNLPVFADQHIKEVNEVTFNGGTHTEMFQISRKDFEKVSKPTFGDFGTHI